MTFEDLRLIDPILKALNAQGYTTPTEIQERSIPILLRGKDLLGCAQTGTGKTAAFAIPILQQLYLDNAKHSGKRNIKSLVVTPTRELALQISESFTAYGKYTNLKNTVIYGGVKQGAQTQALKRGVDILIATPGRLLDLMQQGFISLRDIEYFVLDEADQMLDMGFINDIKKIIAKLPHQRQSLFFSATMAAAIVQLSDKILGNPEKVTINPKQTTAERVEQAMYYVAKKDKTALLQHVLDEHPEDSALVFSRTKHGSDKIVRLLKKNGVIAEAIHGNKSQNARQKALNNFKEGKTKVLIATDIAARGIDISDLALVINYDLPNVPESYVHRIGRTGRASASGIALSFCDGEERAFLRDIERLIGQKIRQVEDNPFPDDGAIPEKSSNPRQGNRGQRNRGQRNQSNKPKKANSTEGDAKKDKGSSYWRKRKSRG
jgi:ATP-dependent RNA helicase RhlE